MFEDKNGNLTAKDTIKLLDEWRKESIELTANVTTACATLESARQKYEKSFIASMQENWYFITIIALAFFIMLAAALNESFTINIGDVKIEKSVCPTP